MTLEETLHRLAANGPRLYSRWSQPAWQLACAGPAARLWDALGANGADEAGFADYLTLLREAVGLQYLSVADLEAGDQASAGFLLAALRDVAPRLLPAAPPAERPRLLALLWNVGEKLRVEPRWVEQYLVLRLAELTSLAELPAFLERVLAEGLVEEREARWEGPFRAAVVDPSGADPAFLPGEMHLVGQRLVCVHDRRSPDRQVAVLLRPIDQGGPRLLGVTTCTGRDGGPQKVEVPTRARVAAFKATGLEDDTGRIATRGGHLVFTTALSQRLWAVEAAS